MLMSELSPLRFLELNQSEAMKPFGGRLDRDT